MVLVCLWAGCVKLQAFCFHITSGAIHRQGALQALPITPDPPGYLHNNVVEYGRQAPRPLQEVVDAALEAPVAGVTAGVGAVVERLTQQTHPGLLEPSALSPRQAATRAQYRYSQRQEWPIRCAISGTIARTTSRWSAPLSTENKKRAVNLRRNSQKRNCRRPW